MFLPRYMKPPTPSGAHRGGAHRGPGPPGRGRPGGGRRGGRGRPPGGRRSSSRSSSAEASPGRSRSRGRNARCGRARRPSGVGVGADVAGPSRGRGGSYGPPGTPSPRGPSPRGRRGRRPRGGKGPRRGRGAERKPPEEEEETIPELETSVSLPSQTDGDPPSRGPAGTMKIQELEPVLRACPKEQKTSDVDQLPESPPTLSPSSSSIGGSGVGSSNSSDSSDTEEGEITDGESTAGAAAGGDAESDADSARAAGGAAIPLSEISDGELTSSSPTKPFYPGAGARTGLPGGTEVGSGKSNAGLPQPPESNPLYQPSKYHNKRGRAAAPGGSLVAAAVVGSRDDGGKGDDDGGGIGISAEECQQEYYRLVDKRMSAAAARGRDSGLEFPGASGSEKEGTNDDSDQEDEEDEDDDDVKEDELYLRLMALRSMAPEMDDDKIQEEVGKSTALEEEMFGLLEEADEAAAGVTNPAETGSSGKGAAAEREGTDGESSSVSVIVVPDSDTDDTDALIDKTLARELGRKPGQAASPAAATPPPPPLPPPPTSSSPDLSFLLLKLRNSLARQKKEEEMAEAAAAAAAATSYSPTQSPIREVDNDESAFPRQLLSSPTPSPPASPPMSPSPESNSRAGPLPVNIPLEPVVVVQLDRRGAKISPFDRPSPGDEPPPPGDDDVSPRPTAYDRGVSNSEPVDMDLGSENEAEIQFFKEQREENDTLGFPSSVWEFGPGGQAPGAAAATQLPAGCGLTFSNERERYEAYLQAVVFRSQERQRLEERSRGPSLTAAPPHAPPPPPPRKRRQRRKRKSANLTFPQQLAAPAAGPAPGGKQAPEAKRAKRDESKRAAPKESQVKEPAAVEDDEEDEEALRKKLLDSMLEKRASKNVEKTNKVPEAHKARRRSASPRKELKSTAAGRKSPPKATEVSIRKASKAPSTAKQASPATKASPPKKAAQPPAAKPAIAKKAVATVKPLARVTSKQPKPTLQDAIRKDPVGLQAFEKSLQHDLVVAATHNPSAAPARELRPERLYDDFALRKKHFPNLSRPFVVPLGGHSSSEEDEENRRPAPGPARLARKRRRSAAKQGGSSSSQFSLSLDQLLREGRQNADKVAKSATAAGKKKTTPPPKPARKHPPLSRKVAPAAPATPLKLTARTKEELIKSSVKHLAPEKQAEYRQLVLKLRKKELEKKGKAAAGAVKQPKVPVVGTPINKPSVAAAPSPGANKPVAPKKSVPSSSLAAAKGEDDPDTLRRQLLKDMQKKAAATAAAVVKPSGDKAEKNTGLQPSPAREKKVVEQKVVEHSFGSLKVSIDNSVHTEGEEEEDEEEEEEGLSEEMKELRRKERQVRDKRRELESSVFKLSAEMSHLLKATAHKRKAEEFLAELTRQMELARGWRAGHEASVAKFRAVVRQSHQAIQRQRREVATLEEECRAAGGDGYRLPGAAETDRIRRKLGAIAESAKQLNGAAASSPTTEKKKEEEGGAAAKAAALQEKEAKGEEEEEPAEAERQPPAAGPAAAKFPAAPPPPSISSSFLAHMRPDPGEASGGILDPHAVLCRFELQGRCNDDSCQFQHTSRR